MNKDEIYMLSYEERRELAASTRNHDEMMVLCYDPEFLVRLVLSNNANILEHNNIISELFKDPNENVIRNLHYLIRNSFRSEYRNPDRSTSDDSLFSFFSDLHNDRQTGRTTYMLNTVASSSAKNIILITINERAFTYFVGRFANEFPLLSEQKKFIFLKFDVTLQRTADTTRLRGYSYENTAVLVDHLLYDDMVAHRSEELYTKIKNIIPYSVKFL